jgi:hypothetical protein
MTRRWGAALLIGGLLALAGARGQEPPAKGDPPPAAPAGPPAPVIRLAPQAGGPPPRALRYALLPDALDLTPGNAAPLWVRAADAARRVKRRLGDKEYRWLSPAETPLKGFPAAEVREFLAPYQAALRHADQAARRDRCDWELPPVTIQTVNTDLPLDEIQGSREVANLLQLRCRLELSEGKFDDAVHTLQTGFALARHLGEGDTLIQSLVGCAVATVMLGRVEEWVQIPGSPNLYWPLTALPAPFVDVRRTVRVELGTVYRSFPALRELGRARDFTPLSRAEVERITEGLLKSWDIYAGGQGTGPDWPKRMGVAALAVKYYPDAKRYLLEHGARPEQVEAMPAVQAVLLYYLDQYNRRRDDVLAWMNLPPWQAREGLGRNFRESVRAARDSGNVLLALLMPAVERAHEAGVRVDRQIAVLRCAEALRLYAAAHEGAPPAKLADVPVPLPLDPVTGQGFDGFYRTEDGKAVLEMPPMPAGPANTGRRFELDRPR